MKRKVVSNELACEAMAIQLRALSVIDDNEIVESFYRVPEGWDVKIVKDNS